MPQRIQFALTIAMMLTGCSSDTPPPVSVNPAEVPILTPKYETPEATFAAAKAAVQSKDYTIFCDCWSPDGLTWLSGGMVLAGNMYRAMADSEIENESDKAVEMKDRRRQVTELLTKHGFPDGGVATLSIQAGDGHSEENVDRQVREQLTTIAQPITDKTAFMVEMFAVMDVVSECPDFNMLPSNAELTEVVIDGDWASATINKQIGDKVRLCPAILEKIDGQWKFD